MAHPVIPHVLTIAAPVAASLGLAVENAVFRTNQSPPVLRLDVRSLTADTGLEDCERMSRAFEPVLDESELFPDAYVLEVSSPGVSRLLESDRDFISFKGFPVSVQTAEDFKGQQEWHGNLMGRDDTVVKISLKGRTVKIPRDVITQVQLEEGLSE
ncbi:ribosome maturation factor RimP [filamentous cyanobacterium LEGE 11480]|uniref:Ribosome maturation factor RimP n=1 Tax=Romeriopsis navalis LEGE 11480 TaxID=2777977 RepID=A0A928VJ99_9CYAN|nr:ribosome maturation factor RimP [Romeriopsis navalis]MBE9029653.1 ribosome maturation factor RimP [Romeriopsis navalis LEGE 11480]